MSEPKPTNAEALAPVVAHLAHVQIAEPMAGSRPSPRSKDHGERLCIRSTAMTAMTPMTPVMKQRTTAPAGSRFFVWWVTMMSAPSGKDETAQMSAVTTHCWTFSIDISRGLLNGPLDSCGGDGATRPVPSGPESLPFRCFRPDALLGACV